MYKRQGVPTYAGRFPKLLQPYTEKIKGNNSLAVFVATYGNRDYEDSLLELKNIFEDNGFKTLAASTFVTEHSSTSKLATKRPNAKMCIRDSKVTLNLLLIKMEKDKLL